MSEAVKQADAVPAIEVGSRWRHKTSDTEITVDKVSGDKCMVFHMATGKIPMPTCDLREFYSPVEPVAYDAVNHPATPTACRRCKGDDRVEVLGTDLEPSVLCLECGEHGPRCDSEEEAVKAWDKQQETTVFGTGAVRSSDAVSVRYDLISPIGQRRLAETYAEGAAKYGVGNWLKGFPASDLLNHLMRHIDLYRSGDRTEDHLAHAAWGLYTLMHFEETRPELFDLIYCPEKETAK